MTRPPHTSTLFPYTTLFRSNELGSAEPWHPKVHKRIREMLIRLRSMSLSWEKGRGNDLKFYDGSLLHLTTNLSADRSEEHTSELQSRENLVCRLLLEKKKQK